MQVSVGGNGWWDSASMLLGAWPVVSSSSSPPSDTPYLEEALLVTHLANTPFGALPLGDTNVSGVPGVGGTPQAHPTLLKWSFGESFPARRYREAARPIEGKAGG